MATNFATDTLKTVTSKATAPTSSVTTTDSAVAEFRDHQPLHQHAQGYAATNGTNGNMTYDTTVGHSAPTLSDSAVAELKAAYVAVEKAIADAKSGGTATDTATTDSTANDTSTSDSSTTDKAATGKTTDTTTDTTTHQPPADPLVKVLAEATGESTATVQGVLQQVRAVLHQEHLTDATSHTGAAETTTNTGASTETSTGGTSTTTASDDTKSGTGDAPHWHDRLIAQHDGTTDAGTGQAAADGGSAIWQHFLNHYASGDSAVTGNATVVAAVDEFVDTVQSLHLDPGHGQMNGHLHGHGADSVHLDTAA